MAVPQPIYDLVLAGGRVCDPANGVDKACDVAIAGDRIAALGDSLAAQARRVLDVTGKIVTPGWVDLHTHVFEWVTTFGLPPDDVGVNSGVTTAVDQGGAGAYTIPAFKHYIADRARTDIRCFPSINAAGTLRGGLAGPILHTPDIVDVDLLVTEAEKHPKLVRGFGEIHGESGAWSRWGFAVVEQARAASDRTGLPLYFHTGELFEVDEANRPDSRSLLPQVLKIARPGDILAHVYSAQHDGVLGADERPSPLLAEAVASGLLLDIGFGINFSYATARRMIAAGIWPSIISSDVHGRFDAMHDDTMLDYSLAGAFARLVALGMPFGDALAAVTVTPARVLREEAEIGTLAVGSRADVTVLEERVESWPLYDSQAEVLMAARRWLPHLVLRAGEPIVPSLRLLRDVVAIPQHAAAA
ncbi:MAG TPA: amidohydrolase/deacetylase family metallohydrolase [Stellaceae bacterium]|jgi:dihydroorotase|nr:amidohydrolase/deacetylase family metallohydrolase [Stellaceae bacterium]